MNVFKKHWLFFVLVLVILFTRLLIFNKDATQFWADESRYPGLIASLDEVVKSRNYLAPIQQLFNIDARPGAGLFYFFPAFLEFKYPNIPFGLYYNLIINSVNLILIFFIVKKIRNKNTAILATLLVTLSITSLIYIRHMLPYDIALLLLLIGLYLQVYFKKTFLFGLLVGLSFLTYPSYYYYIIPIPLILFLYLRSIKAVLLFIIGVTFILISVQFFSIAIDRAYFRSLHDQSEGVTSINQGDYIPATTFISEYILAADGYWNLFLILAIFPGIFLIRDRKVLVFFGLYLACIFLIQELYSHILQRHTLYGRTIRPLYFLGLCLIAFILEKLFSKFKSKKIYLLCLSILFLISILNWIPRFLTYKNLTYPKQFQQKARDYLNSKYDKYEVTDTFYVNYWNTKNPDSKLIKHFFGTAVPGKFYTVNAVQTFPYYGNLNLDGFCKNEILLKELHSQYIFKPYQFEGYKKIMRNKMEDDPLYYQLIYCKATS